MEILLHSVVSAADKQIKDAVGNVCCDFVGTVTAVSHHNQSFEFVPQLIFFGTLVKRLSRLPVSQLLAVRIRYASLVHYSTKFTQLYYTMFFTPSARNSIKSSAIKDLER